MSEYQNHVYAIRYLMGKIKKGNQVIWVDKPFPQIEDVFHCYQGRHEEEGFFLKELGVRPGVHDIHIIYRPSMPGQSGYTSLEMKHGKNGLSDHQKDFGSKMTTCGHTHGVAWSVAEVRDHLIGIGLECKNPHVIEPPRPLEEQRKAVHNYYGRTEVRIKTLEQVMREAREEKD